MRVRVSAVAVCLVFYVGTLSSVWGELQQNASDSNSEGVSGPAVITAKPERVTFSNGSGSTQIEWDTGNGSMGFVFVTEDGGKPVVLQTVCEVKRSLHGSENILMSSNSMATISGRHCSLK